MNNTFTFDEFIRSAFDDLRSAEDTYSSSGSINNSDEMIPGRYTISNILNYSQVLDVIRFSDKQNFNFIVN
ncbi:hypothetical protein ACFL6I_25995 [candidate division KSB1 bacterium]